MAWYASCLGMTTQNLSHHLRKDVLDAVFKERIERKLGIKIVEGGIVNAATDKGNEDPPVQQFNKYITVPSSNEKNTVIRILQLEAVTKTLVEELSRISALVYNKDIFVCLNELEQKTKQHLAVLQP